MPARELDGADLISFREGAGLRTAADQILAGIGLAILPVAFIEQSRYPLWSRPLDPPVHPSLMLIWRRRRRRSPAAAAFLHHLAAHAPRPQPVECD